MNATIKPDHGEGSVRKLRNIQPDGTVKESRYWYLLYYVGGKQIKKNSKCTEYIDAYNMLQRERGKLEVGEIPSQSQRVFRYEDMREMLLANYQAKNRYVEIAKDGTVNFRGRASLDKFFCGMAVVDMNEGKIAKYITACWAEGLKGPAIRRRLDSLGKMFTIAKKAHKIGSVPYIEKPEQSGPAGKIITPKQFSEILRHVPKINQPLFVFMHATMIRVSTALRITWDMLNEEGDHLALPASIMKNRLPFTLQLRGLALAPIAKQLKAGTRTAGEPLFYSEDYLAVWQRACVAANVATYDRKRAPKYQGPRIHDLRVAGCRDAIRAGVPQDLVMKLGTWQTTNVFSRYNIVDAKDIGAALEKVGKYQAKEAA